MIGESFPYTNFHDLNLDWIIKTAKELAEKNLNLEYISEKADAIIERLEELENLDEEFEEVKTQFDELLIEIVSLQQEVNTINRPLANIICLTDSYGTNDPDLDRYSWCDHLKEMANIPSEKYKKLYASGASFGDEEEAKNLYYIFTSGTENMTSEEKKNVSDIIIVSGINEWNEDNNYAITQMENLNTYIKNNFENTRIWLFDVQWDKLANIRYMTAGTNNATSQIYQRTAIALGWHYIFNKSALIMKTAYVDNVHPLSAASRNIAAIIYNTVNGNSGIVINQNNRVNVQLETGTATRSAGSIYFDGNQWIWTSATFTGDAMPNIPAQFNGMSRIGKLITPAIIGYDDSIVANPISIPCELGLQIGGSWQKVAGSLRIIFEDNDPYLYFRNDGEFTSVPTPAYSNITDSYIHFGTATIPIWD